MSLFQFIASDKLLKEVYNPYVELISINEALRRNLEVANSMMNNKELDKDEKIIMFCDSEEHLDEIEIWSIWLDEYKSANIKSINIDELSITDLAFLDTSNGYEKPKCLIIKK